MAAASSALYALAQQEIAMTYLSSILEFIPVPSDCLPTPEPLAPEEVLRLLLQEPPQGEYSVDVL